MSSASTEQPITTSVPDTPAETDMAPSKNSKKSSKGAVARQPKVTKSGASRTATIKGGRRATTKALDSKNGRRRPPVIHLRRGLRRQGIEARAYTQRLADGKMYTPCLTTGEWIQVEKGYSIPLRPVSSVETIYTHDEYVKRLLSNMACKGRFVSPAAAIEYIWRSGLADHHKEMLINNVTQYYHCDVEHDLPIQLANARARYNAGLFKEYTQALLPSARDQSFQHGFVDIKKSGTNQRGTRTPAAHPHPVVVNSRSGDIIEHGTDASGAVVNHEALGHVANDSTIERVLAAVDAAIQ